MEPILERDHTLQVATGIVNIWTAAAGPVAESFHRIDKAYPGPLPARHRRRPSRGDTPEYTKPIDALTEYLDKLDEYGVPKDRRVVAALGPQVLKLSARAQRGRASLPDDAGAHRAGARADRARRVPRARAQGGADHRRGEGPRRRPQGAGHLPEPANYLNNWKRLGFTDEDVAKPGSDRLVDAVVAYGTPDAIAARLKEHLDAGADHVPVQVLTRT